MTKYHVLGIITAFSLLAGIASFYFWGDDNPVEEACEDLINDEIGIDIDLSPSSPEYNASGTTKSAS